MCQYLKGFDGGSASIDGLPAAVIPVMAVIQGWNVRYGQKVKTFGDLQA